MAIFLLTVLSKGPAGLSIIKGSSKVVVDFDRSDRRILPVKVEYSGFVLQEGFIVGYGIDHLGMFRNLPSVVTANQTLLDEEFARGESKLADEIVKIARGKETVECS